MSTTDKNTKSKKSRRTGLIILILCIMIGGLSLITAYLKDLKKMEAQQVPEEINDPLDDVLKEEEKPSQASEAVIKSLAPAAEVKPEESPEPSPEPVIMSYRSQYSSNNTAIQITKQPESVVISVGGEATFSADAVGYKWCAWRFVSPDGQTEVIFDVIRNRFQYVYVSGGNKLDFQVFNIPFTMDGWYVSCLFSDNQGNMVISDEAMISVIDGVEGGSPYAHGEDDGASLTAETPTPAQTSSPTEISVPFPTVLPTTTPDSIAPVQSCTHHWVEDTQIINHPEETESVWIVDQAAWDESVPIDSHYFCCTCGADLGYSAVPHCLDAEAGGAHEYGSSYYLDYIYSTVHHDEVGHYQIKVIQEAWTETVRLGTYHCSLCGETK